MSSNEIRELKRALAAEQKKLAEQALTAESKEAFAEKKRSSIFINGYLFDSSHVLIMNSG